MKPQKYLVWFLGTVALAVIGVTAFNAWADKYILSHAAGPSFQTVSGFERVLKPAWLDSIRPDMVFVGTSDMRQGFDPVLIDKALGVRSFNYGFSSVTAYETRRMVQDAAAQPNVRTIIASANSFAGGSAAQPTAGGFDELRIAVTPDGKPTPRRGLWLFTTRYLSGGATGMHAAGLYMLAQLKTGESAADRPDIFGAYTHMTKESFARDMERRAGRSYRLNDWQRGQLRAALEAICDKPIHFYLFFPPENASVVERYLANDGEGLLDFKRKVLADVRDHNAHCTGKASLFDFMTRNQITGEGPNASGEYPHYVDLVHFTPQVGAQLVKTMLGRASFPGNGDLTNNPDAEKLIAREW
jgi:hypothetical protein